MSAVVSGPNPVRRHRLHWFGRSGRRQPGHVDSPQDRNIPSHAAIAKIPRPSLQLVYEAAAGGTRQGGSISSGEIASSCGRRPRLISPACHRPLEIFNRSLSEPRSWHVRSHRIWLDAYAGSGRRISCMRNECTASYSREAARWAAASRLARISAIIACGASGRFRAPGCRGRSLPWKRAQGSGWR